ncbi:unnamed protein product [Calypogeia fissa]
MFRCFEGELTEEEISSILEAMKAKTILLKKYFSYKGDELSMEDMARKLKTAKKLQDLIMVYYESEHHEEFGKVVEWNNVTDKIPALKEDDEFRRCRRAAGEPYLANLCKRNFANKGCPPSLVLRLEDLYCRQFGNQQDRVEPYMTFHSGNLMKTMTPDTKDFPRSPCPLAIMDFSRKGKCKWTDSELQSLFDYIMYCSASTIVIVITVLPE